jgi:amino acid adenylation domain-containing protein
MIPAAFVSLDSLPLNLQGKVDRQALPPPDGIRSTPSKSYVPPRTATEEQIASIWADVLGLERIGGDDHFFELGGHSLLAAQVISRIRKDFAVDIPFRAIFEAPTVAGIAALIENTKPTDAKPREMLAPTSAPEGNLLPLSFSQTGMWFMEQLAPNSAAYNIAATIRFTGKLQKEALQRSLNELVRRHESLRTTFQNTGEELVRIVTPELVLKIPEMDLRNIPSTSRLEEAKRILKEEAGRPFNLAQGPLIRVLILRLDEQDHVLLLNIHHAVSDQWSMGVIAREMTSFYNGQCEGAASCANSLPVQYSDFAAWQGKWLNSADWETQLSYWKRKLANFQPLEFPTDRARPPVQTFHGAHDRLSLSKETIDGLKRLSAQENATLYMAFLAAFKALLLRYYGQEDIAIGSPIANRNRIEWEEVVGTFINILVLRTDLSGNPTFREVLQRVRKVILEAFSHQEIPFQKLVEELQPKRETTRPPLVQVLFNFHHAPPGNIDLASLSWVPFEIDQWASQFDISVTIDTEITRKIWMGYNTDLYDAETIARLLKHYKKFIEEALSNPDQPIQKIQILTEPERHLLTEWNETNRNYRDKCTHELFEEQVEQSSDAVAVAFKGEELTYRELNRRANQLASYLQSLGVGPETLVGLCIDRSLETVIGLLGILKAGGAYVPIDPAYPSERIRLMIEDTGMRFLLTQERLLKNLPQKENLKVIPLDRLTEDPDLKNLENPISLSHLQNLAYVIYTSGSTGKPKGVQIEHKALVNFLHSVRQEPGISKHDVLLSVTPLSFDIAALELFLPLVVGAKVLLVNREIASDGRRLGEQLESSRATVMQATPATWQILLEAGWKGTEDFKILCGGEVLSWDLAKGLVGKAAAVWNLYGPTETTVWSTTWQVDSSYGRMSIGRPIANTQIHILDSNLQSVPIGVVGELYIGGDGLARGYLNRPELTAEKFIPNPFSDDPKARLYKTGDLARYLPDGNIEFLGRKDYQVKIRGFRAEPGEIEAVLGQHPTVQQAIVVAREDTPGGKRLVAYVVPHQPGTATAGDLRSFLKTKLPEYMLPSAWVSLDALPLTPNGKVDREALPLPDKTRAEPQEGFVAPQNSVERQLAQIWEKLLGIQPIGVKDNFFDLGGHSLLAVRLIAQMEGSFGKDLPLATLFKAPTIEQLAGLLGNQDSSAWSWLVPFQTRGSKPPFFCIHGGGEPLAKLLGTDQPLYGLHPHGQDGRQAPCKVEDMAADYVKEIRMVQPEGPYFIGGYSFGGMVAFEVAQQLQQQGQQVALLALLDPTEPAYREAPSLSPHSSQFLPPTTLLREGAQHLRNLAALGLREKLAYLWERVMWRFQATKRILKMMVCKFYLDTGRRVPFKLRMFYFFQISYQAAREYTPQIYTDSTILFRTERKSYDSQWDWSKLTAGKLRVHEIPGKHLDILKEPHVQVLVQHLKEYLG